LLKNQMQGDETYKNFGAKLGLGLGITAAPVTAESKSDDILGKY